MKLLNGMRLHRAAVTKVRKIAMTLTFVPGLLAATMTDKSQATDIQKVISPKGIEVWLVEEHAVPMIALNFSLQAGASQDPDKLPGLSNFLTSVLDEGAGDIKAQEFQRRLEEKAIRMSFDTGRDYFYGDLVTLTKYRDEAASLFTLALNKPRFDAEAVDRMRRQLLTGLKQSSRKPGTIAARIWREKAFGKHPYGRPTKGTEKSLTAIKPADLRAFHAGLFARDTLKVSVVGAIKPAEVGKLVDQIFGNWPATAKRKAIPAAALGEKGLVFEKLAVPQASIRFGMPGIKRTDKDFIPAYIVNHILGGGTFSSRLYTEIREKRGLAYGVYSYLTSYKGTELVMGGLATQADKANEAIAIIRQEFAKMGKDGPTAEELQKAKDYLIGSYPLRFDSSKKIARNILSMQQENLPIDYIKTRNAMIRKVSLADVKRVAKRLYGGKDLLVAKVGPAK